VTLRKQGRAMLQGLVYVAVPDANAFVGHRVERHIVALERLQPARDGSLRLCGTYVEVHNSGEIHEPGKDGRPVNRLLGDTASSTTGSLFFDRRGGGARLYKVEIADQGARDSYAAASRFGEVNPYYHADRIAAYIASLLRQIDAPPLPRVTLRVSAHG